MSVAPVGRKEITPGKHGTGILLLVSSLKQDMLSLAHRFAKGVRMRRRRKDAMLTAQNNESCRTLSFTSPPINPRDAHCSRRGDQNDPMVKHAMEAKQQLPQHPVSVERNVHVPRIPVFSSDVLKRNTLVPPKLLLSGFLAAKFVLRGQRLTSISVYSMNHDPFWVKSAKIGSKPMRNQSLSGLLSSPGISTDAHCPLSAHPNIL